MNWQKLVLLNKIFCSLRKHALKYGILYLPGQFPCLNPHLALSPALLTILKCLKYTHDLPFFLSLSLNFCTVVQMVQLSTPRTCLAIGWALPRFVCISTIVSHLYILHIFSVEDVHCCFTGIVICMPYHDTMGMALYAPWTSNHFVHVSTYFYLTTLLYYC